jgi:enterochelin esterase family protein
MKSHLAFKIMLLIFFSSVIFAQTNQQSVVEDFQPSSANQPGKEFPQVNSEGRVRVSISAPDAQRVQLDIGGVKYDLIKDDKGIWTGESNPQDEGFHYYQLWIDGAAVPDPGSLFYYGAGRWGSGVEIQADDQEFYSLKNVPHGKVSQNIYFSNITNSFRRCFVYTPPDYEKNIHPATQCYIFNMAAVKMRRAGRLRVKLI